jgi:hypothetical protein
MHVFAVLLFFVALMMPAQAQQVIPGPGSVDIRRFLATVDDNFGARLAEANVFYGDFTGDGQPDALGFFFADPEGGNSTELRVFSFRNEGGGGGGPGR